MSVHFHKDAFHDTKELAIHQRYHYKTRFDTTYGVSSIDTGMSSLTFVTT